VVTKKRVVTKERGRGDKEEGTWVTKERESGDKEEGMW
jgi:hypothetical protein